MTGLLIPAVLLILVAAATPFAMARVLPEGIAGLIVNGAISALVLTGMSAAYFLWAYGRTDTRVVDLLGAAPGATLVYFLRLGVQAGLIWAPVMILSLSAQPKRWKTVQW